MINRIERFSPQNAPSATENTLWPGTMPPYRDESSVRKIAADAVQYG